MTRKRSSRRSGAVRRLGSESPRVFTPPLRELTSETSRGFEFIEFSETILELTLLPWQKWLAIHALELNEDGTFRFRTVVLLVARQNGKSTFMQALSLWVMFVHGAPLVIGTAQSLDIAEEQWSEAVELTESIPELADMIQHVNRTNGKKALELTSGERYKVAAASRRGGRGLTGDLILLDELREHQNWEAWGAVTKTTLARPHAQIWAASNAGDIASVVLRHLRSLAHRYLGWPDGEDGMVELPDSVEEDDSLGIFEWSAAPDRDVWDRDGWAEANPSLGYTIMERAIASAASSDPEHVFRTEVMCQFVNLASTGPFPTGAWAATQVEKVVRDESRPAVYCVDMSHDRTWMHVALAFWDSEGRVRAEVVASRPGTDWVLPWLIDPARRVAPEHVTMQTRGAPVSSLADGFRDAGIELIPWEGAQLSGWHGLTYDLVRAAVADDRDENIPLPFTHGVQPNLDVAAVTAQIKAIGDGWVIDRKNSPQDAAPLVSVIGAVGALLSNPEPAAVSAYEGRGLLVLD